MTWKIASLLDGREVEWEHSAETKRHALTNCGPIKVLRIPGPTSRQAEEQVAEYIERAIEQHDGRKLGVRTRGDGTAGQRVDFTYDATTPAAAMEITGIVESEVLALGAELLKLEGHLSHVSVTESLGSWQIGVRTGSELRVLGPLLIRLMRSFQGFERLLILGDPDPPVPYIPEQQDAFARAVEAGLQSALRWPLGTELSILPPISDSPAKETGFEFELVKAIEDNRAKLGEARPRETHLVVVALRYGLSSEPSLTPPPTLTEEIDHLWVMHAYFNAKWAHRLWRTNAGLDSWQLMNDASMGAFDQR